MIILYYINLNQQKMLEAINKFGGMTYNQLKEFNKIKNLDKELKSLVNRKKVKIVNDNVYVPVGKREVNIKIIKALEVCTYLNSIDSEISIEWCNLESFPFTLAFFRNDKVFDICVINEGEELIYAAAVNRTAAERVIVMFEKLNQIEKFKINKQVKYCTIKDGAVIFLQEGDD